MTSAHLVRSGAVKIARDSLALFRRRDFRLLMGTQWLAQAADGLVGVTLAKHIAFGGQAGFSLEEARTPEEILRIALLTVLPYAFLSPLLGVLIDRWDRRSLLVSSTGIRVVLLGTIAALGIDRVGDAALYGSFLLILAGTRLLLAVKGASLPVVLGERELLHGNSISQAGSALFQVGGAGVGLVGSGLLGTEFLLAGGTLVYAAATACALAIGRLGYSERRRTLAAEIRRIGRNLLDGIREVLRRPPAALSLAGFLALRTLVSGVVLAVGLASRGFLVREGSLIAVVPAVAGVLGATVGFVSSLALKDRVGPVWILVPALAAAGLGVVVFGGVITLAGLSLVAFSIGLGFFLGKIAVDTLMQESLSDSYRGRGFGLQDMVYNLSWILPSVALWALWSAAGPRTILIGAGILFLVTAGAIALLARRSFAGPQAQPHLSAAD
jgi:hypothetical protein